MTKPLDLEKTLEKFLFKHPELIDDDLFGIKPGMEILGFSTIKKQDAMPDGTKADIVVLERTRVTVVEIKKVYLDAKTGSCITKDVVDQVVGYLRQCRVKYPDRGEYRGFVVGTGIQNPEPLKAKISRLDEIVTPLIFGLDIPALVTLCSQCGRAVAYDASHCPCGGRLTGG